MDISVPGPIVLPLPPLPVPRPAPNLRHPHTTPHPESPLPTPTPDLPSPADELPAHSPLPPTYNPPLPNMPAPPPPEAAESAEAETAILQGGQRPPKRRREQREDMGMLLQRIVGQFPPCRFVAAYGSAVFEQPEAPTAASAARLTAPLAALATAPPMLDLLLVVDDPLRFHRDNLSAHPSHYSFLKHLGGARAVAAINELPAHLYYNTNVPIASDDADTAPQLVKYGVVSTNRVMEDLTRWSTLYTAGRMHKPVRIVKPSPSLEPNLALNLSSALTVACYLAPTAELSEVELFTLLASLSYMGDVRMGIAEDPLKILRIVTGSYPHFQQLYSQHTAQCEWLLDAGAGSDGMRRWRVKDGAAHRRRMEDALPSHLHDTLAASNGTGERKWWEGASVAEQQARMRAGLASIVRRSSWQQSMKGVLTAGVRKGLAYGLRKIAKRWK